MPLILIVEDEPDLQDVLAFSLKREGFETLVAATGAEALRLARQRPPDLVLLDWMLPDISGTDVCRELEASPTTKRCAIVMLTARSQEADRIEALELGVDDFVAKPFSVRELVLRIRAILRRAQPAADGELLSAGPLAVDPRGHRVQVRGADVSVTALELRILAALLRRAGRVVSREQLLTEAWTPDDDVTERAVDTHIKRLRGKLGDSAHLIETVRGFGYRVRDA